LAGNGSWRHLDTAPEGGGFLLATSSLSADGRMAAFGTPSGAVLVDITTGARRSLPGVSVAGQPVWLSDEQVLLSDAALYDRASGATTAAPVGPQNCVSPRSGARAGTAIELLSAGQPLTAPARVRRWSLADRTSSTIPLSGQLAGLIGVWEGAGFGAGDDRVARLCRPSGSLTGSVRVSRIIAVVSPKTGEVLHALLIDSAVSGEPSLLGWDTAERVLLSLTRGGTQDVVSWSVGSGTMSLVVSLGFLGTVTVGDPSRAV
jgi:hypothetical protein